MGSSVRTSAAVGGAGAVILLALFGAIAARHGVNADEGFYVLAGLRVRDGHHLYADFFYPQMPYLPLAGSIVLRWLDASLFAARLLSVVPGAILGGVLMSVAYRRCGHVAAALAVGGAYGAFALNLNYLTVTKTYGLSNLAMIVAFLLTMARRPHGLASFAAGLCIAIAVGTRLPAAPVALLLAYWQLRRGGAALASFAAGAFVGALPCLWLFANDPGAFWFDNVGFHELRKEMTGVLPVLRQKAEILAKWLLLPQNLVMWVGAAAGLVADARRAWPPFLCALGLAALYLYATPTYLEYMVQIVPFLLLASLPALTRVQLRSPAIALAAGVYAVGLVVALRPTAAESERGRKLSLWDLDRVHAVAARLRSESDAGDRILSWWEGYPWLAERGGYTGVGFWESNAAKKLSAEERARYHVAGRDDLVDLVRRGDPRLVVFPEGKWRFLREAVEERYAPVAEFGTIRIYGRKDVGTHSGEVDS